MIFYYDYNKSWREIVNSLQKIKSAQYFTGKNVKNYYLCSEIRHYV